MTSSSLMDLTSQPAAVAHDNVLVAELITDIKSLGQLRASWDALYKATGSTNPFGQWTWFATWWQVFAQRKPFVQDRPHVIVLRDEQGVARAIVPFILTVWGRGPAAVRGLRLYGYNGSFTELREPLIWPGWEIAAGRGLVTALHAQRWQYHWCVLPGLVEGSPLEQWLVKQSEMADWTWPASVQAYVLPLAESWDAFRGGLKRNIKESLRHCYNSLKREGHEFSFEAIGDAALMPAVLDEFFRLHAARAAMPGAQWHPNHYATPERQQFLRRLAAELAPQGRFLVCRLYINGAVVASRIVMPAGDSLYLYYSGYDPEWSRYSIMTTLTAEIIKMAIADGKCTVHLSTGADVSKTRWGPQEQIYRSLRIVAPTVVAGTVDVLYEQGLRAGHRVRASRASATKYILTVAARLRRNQERPDAPQAGAAAGNSDREQQQA